MKHLVAKIWVPALLVMLAAVQSFGIDAARAIDFRRLADSLILNRLDDTVAATDFAIDSTLAAATDSLATADSLMTSDTLTDSTALADSSATADSTEVADTLVLSPKDTIRIPDSLEFKDPFKFKYYIALKDSLTRIHTRWWMFADLNS